MRLSVVPGPRSSGTSENGSRERGSLERGSLERGRSRGFLEGMVQGEDVLVGLPFGS